MKTYMRALSVRQPYAALIAAKLKDPGRGYDATEYRSWKLSPGPLLIVASRTLERDAVDELTARERKACGDLLERRGHSVCITELLRCDGDDGEYAWRLKVVRVVRAEARLLGPDGHEPGTRAKIFTVDVSRL